MFRLSTLLLAAASAEEFCLDEASSLMQEAKKPVKTNRRDPKPLAGLLESARGFLTNGATPDVINFTQTALDEVANSIIPTLESESLADKAWMDTELARFGEALNELAVSNSAVHQWNAEELQASDDHKSCRATEKQKCDGKRNCEMALYGLWLEWVREETQLREIHTHLETHFCAQDEHGNYIANGTQHSFRVASVPWMTSYTEQKGACDLAEAAYDDQIPHCVLAHGELDHWSGECNAKLDDLEGKACAHASAIAESLNLFHSEWSSLHASYQGITDLVYNQTQDRHKEYKVLVVVQCLLDRVTEYNGRPCDEATGTVDDNMAHCEERGETLTLCAERPALCPTFEPPPAMPPHCTDRNSVVGPCLPDPTPRPCTQDWEDAEMTEGEQPWQLPILPNPTFTETNPGCNEYPDCSVCSGEYPVALADYYTWVEPPASFALEDAIRTYNDVAEDYAHRHFGASVDGCSSDNSNSDATRGDQSGQAIPLVAHIVDDTAAVRCCSQDGSSCISQVHGVCNDVATFHEAISICRSAGMRLCSEAEMGTGVCCGTGCWFNHYASWISDALAESALAEQQDPTYD